MTKKREIRGMVRRATVLSAVGTRVLTKTKDATTGATVGDYDDVKNFKVEPIEWRSVEGLFAILKRLEGQKQSAIIRGQIKPGVDTSGTVRRKLHGDEASFDDVPRAWFALDVDGAKATGVDVRDIRAVAQWLCTKYVPHVLAEVDCVVQLSSSHGWKDDRVYARIWYELDRPLIGAALRFWLSELKAMDAAGPLGAIDPALCSAVQIHYTAAPNIIAGADPVASRLTQFVGDARCVPADPIAIRWHEYCAARDEARALRAIKAPMASEYEARIALSAINALDPDCDYSQWLAIGMALHSRWPGDEGLKVWDDWSSGGGKYTAGVCDAKWLTFKADGVELGTLFGLAMKAGWIHPGPDPSKAGVRTEAEVSEPEHWTPPETLPAWLTDEAPEKEPAPLSKAPLRVEAGKVQFRFGKQVWMDSRVEGGGFAPASKLAMGVWPVSVVQDIDTNARSVLLDFLDASGRRHRAAVPSAAWATKQVAGTAGQSLMAVGVNVMPGKAGDLIMALGAWACGEHAPIARGVSSPGWRLMDDRTWVYTSEPDTYGAPWLWTGPEPARRRGNIHDWRAQISALAYGSKAMALAIGVAFAGALVEPLGSHSFMIHYFGNSSTGKSLATFVAQSVWAQPERVRSWKDTASFIAESLSLSSGRALVLDDIRKARRPAEVGELILSLSDNRTKGRLASTGSMLGVKDFALALLSSGEQSLEDFLEGVGDVGHGVRAIDIEIRPGESTKSAAHAHEIELWRKVGAWGWAGPLFAQKIQSLISTSRGLTRIRDKIHSFNMRILSKFDKSTAQAPSTMRVAKSIAMACVALEAAIDEGVCPDLGLTPDELANWALSKITLQRQGADSPETRAVARLIDEIERSPGHYPAEVDISQKQWRGNELRGVLTDENTLKVTTGMMKPFCRAVRVPVDTWLAWLVENGLAQKWTKTSRVAGKVGRFYVINLKACRGASDRL